LWRLRHNTGKQLLLYGAADNSPPVKSSRDQCPLSGVKQPRL
jgi:hypothetical protein